MPKQYPDRKRPPFLFLEVSCYLPGDKVHLEDDKNILESKKDASRDANERKEIPEAEKIEKGWQNNDYG